MSKKQGKFTLLSKTKISDIIGDKVSDLPESDLCFQEEGHIIQYKFEKPEEESKPEVKPGIYMLTNSNYGINPKKTELKQSPLLETIDNTTAIIKEAKTFFSKLSIYEELEIAKKRSVLAYSSPGMGKSTAIAKICNSMCEEDKGTVVLNWPTSDVDAEDVAKFLSIGSEFTQDCTRMILIIEDIGGGERDDYSSKSASAGLLNLLDGIDVMFKLPTFIIATTNHPEDLVQALADRPGRFDLKIEFKAPDLKERIALAEFISKRKLDDQEKSAFAMNGADKFSIAHIKEIIIRSRLHDKSYGECIKELVDSTKQFNKGFQEEKSMGL